VTVFVAEVLAAKLAGVVGVKTAVRESAPSGSAVVARAAFPRLTVTGLPSVEDPLMKVTVPAAEGAMVAVSVTLAPKDAVVMVVAGTAVSAAVSVVVVAVAAAWASVKAAVESKSSSARLPQPLRILVGRIAVPKKCPGGESAAPRALFSGRRNILDQRMSASGREQARSKQKMFEK
jgi:hypothetical protein